MKGSTNDPKRGFRAIHIDIQVPLSWMSFLRQVMMMVSTAALALVMIMKRQFQVGWLGFWSSRRSGAYNQNNHVSRKPWIVVKDAGWLICKPPRTWGILAYKPAKLAVRVLSTLSRGMKPLRKKTCCGYCVLLALTLGETATSISAPILLKGYEWLQYAVFAGHRKSHQLVCFQTQAID